MFYLLLFGVFALAFALAGAIVWLGLWLFKIRGRGRKILKITAVAYLAFMPFFIFVVFPFIAAAMIASAGTRPQDLRLEIDPAAFGCRFQEVEFESRDGVRLAGWWMRGREDMPVFVLCHGLFRDRKEVVERACSFNKLGFSALAFDLRRHGKSGGGSVSMGYLERFDVLGAIDYADRRPNAGVVTLGVSMGANATLQAGPGFGEEVVAVVADSPFLNLHETVDRHVGLFLNLPAFPFSKVFVWRLSQICGFDPDQLDAAKAVSEMPRIPILLIYGKDDNRMPASTAEAVYGAVSQSSKEIVFFERAGHGAAWRTHPQRYVNTVTHFLSAYGIPVGNPDVEARIPSAP